MNNHRNAKSKAPQGKPSATGREGSGLNDIKNPGKENKIADKYTDEKGRPDANAKVRHENRNTDKGRESQGKDTTSI